MESADRPDAGPGGSADGGKRSVPACPLSAFGLGTIDHPAPFHCSAKVRALSVGVSVVPTAHTSVAEMAATPVRSPEPVGVGLATRFQAEPFQCPINVLPLALTPTAQALVREMAATAARLQPRQARRGLACQYLSLGSGL